MIAKLEAGLKVSGSPQLTMTNDQLNRYDRFYAGVTVNGQRQIRGVLLVPPNREGNPGTGVHITDVEYLPKLRGYGCANISVTYWVDRNFSYGQCDTAGAVAPPSQQPHWKPDEQTAARMEAAVGERMRRAGLPDLSIYERYYWGVTIDQKPMIEGSMGRGQAGDGHIGQIHLSSELGPPGIEGACDNIRATYDVSAGKLVALACNGSGYKVLKPQD